MLPNFPHRCASLHSVGPSGLLLCHPDCPVRFEPLQQKPDRACSPRGGLWHSRGEGQQGQHSVLGCAQRLQPESCSWQDKIYLCASVQRSRYVIHLFDQMASGQAAYLWLTVAAVRSICNCTLRIDWCSAVNNGHSGRTLPVMVDRRTAA